MHRWLRTHRAPLGGSVAPAHTVDQQRRDSAEYHRAHSEARQLVAAYLQEITVTRSAQSELASPALLPSARIELARRSAA
jgi:hypothetical protein